MTNNNAAAPSSINTAKRFRIIATVAMVAFLVVFGIAGYFALRNIAQVETFKAKVAGHVATVNSPGAGRIVSLPFEVGDYVAQDEELGVVEVVSTAPTSGARLLVPLRAPMSGVVIAKSAEEDDTRAAGQPLLTIADPDDVWVEANIHESRISRVKVGQPVRVRIRALRVSFPGRVAAISPATSATLTGASTSTTVEIPVRIAIDLGGYTLYPGMSAEVHVQLEPRLW